MNKKIFSIIVAIVIALSMTLSIYAASSSGTLGYYNYSCSISNSSYTVNASMSVTKTNSSAPSSYSEIRITGVISPNTPINENISGYGSIGNSYTYEKLVVSSLGQFYINGTRVAALYGR